MQENQARRLLNDLRRYRAFIEDEEGTPLPESVVAYRWLSEIFEATLAAIPKEHRAKLEPAQMVAASSVLLLLNGSAAAVGPVLAGSLIAAFGPPAYFATLATLTGALTVYDLWRKSRRRPVPLAQKGPFINAQPQGMTGQIVGCAGLDQTGPQPDLDNGVELDSRAKA